MTLRKDILMLFACSMGALWLSLSCARQEAVTARADGPAANATPTATAPETRHEPIAPIPLTAAVDARKVSLGKQLFHDPKLSRDKSISCGTCHALERGGVDHRARSIGVEQHEGHVNAPTVFNSALNFRQFWDGRADTLELQVDGPLLSSLEMGATWAEVLARLAATPAYATAFQQIYPDGLRRENVRNAIAEFERTLLTPNSRFDRYLRGDAAALTDAERSGYAKFKSYGCISCHQGVNIGANMFQRMGVIRDYFADRGNITEADYGRYNVTRNEADRFVFKVPSLRNVAATAPYFHDGSAATLEEAVTVMARYQLGRPLPPADLADIVSFLRTLTGEYEGKSL